LNAGRIDGLIIHGEIKECGWVFAGLVDNQSECPSAVGEVISSSVVIAAVKRNVNNI